MQYFGTDGIRQKAELFTPDFLTAIVNGLVNYAGSDIRVLIAGDTRESTEWILADLESALETFGVEYSNAGILPTPAINHCFFEMGFDFAIDVTASHNPYTDNGIKIFERGHTHGKKLSEEGRKSIEEALSKHQIYDLTPATIREDLHQEAVETYQKHLLNYIEDANFKGLHIGMDCANGATSVINKTVFEKFGAKVKLIHSNKEYNVNVNKDCGSTHPESLSELVKTNHLDFGVAFDGDGDRCLLVDKKGRELDGDYIIAILANYLELDSVVVTVMANQGLMNWAKTNNIHLEITSVGDQNVAEAMTQKSIKLGGEQSGHIILPNESTGDGMLTALMIAKVVSETNKSLDELASIITKTPQIIVNFEATSEQKQALKTNEQAKSMLLEYNQKLTDADGRLLVRPSGTEPLIRITMWGENEAEITSLAEELKTKLGEIL